MKDLVGVLRKIYVGYDFTGLRAVMFVEHVAAHWVLCVAELPTAESEAASMWLGNSLLSPTPEKKCANERLTRCLEIVRALQGSRKATRTPPVDDFSLMRFFPRQCDAYNCGVGCVAAARDILAHVLKNPQSSIASACEQRFTWSFDAKFADLLRYHLAFELIRSRPSYCLSRSLAMFSKERPARKHRMPAHLIDSAVYKLRKSEPQ